MIALQKRRQAYPDLFLALTEFSRSRFVANGVDANKICVKPNFVSPDPGERRGAGEYAAVVGRLSSEKGLPTLLAAWKQMKTRVPLMVAGDGPMLGEIRAKAAELGLEQVIFTGRLPRSEAQELMKNARFLVASSECYENFPMGIAEAFACGLPVICSRLGAMQEIVQDGRTGLHFTPGDAADLAEKVEWAWARPEPMRAMGQAARREYETRYTAEKNYPMLMAIYQRAMGQENSVGRELLAAR
jgi:glycosyltransferase involved in cell wall biosynthesis